MGNKIFRAVIATILVVAMTLTFVGCNSSSGTGEPIVTTNPDATAAPVITQTPVEKTPTPTTAPKYEIAEDFGLEITSKDGVYGTKLEDGFGDEVNHGYFEISWDKTTAQEHYEITLEIDIESDEEDYYFIITIPSGNASSQVPKYYTGSAYSGLTYNTDNEYYYPDEDTVYFTITDEALTIWLEDADEYELTCEVFVTDMAIDYGAWNSDDDPDEYEFALTSSLEIKKEQITIEIPPAVIVENEYSLYALAGSEYGNNKKYTTSLDSERNAMTIYYPESYAFGDYEIGLSYEMEYVEEGVVGNYTVEIAEEYTFGSKIYDDLDDLNDELVNYEIATVKDTSLYVISSYDYAEIADVITSIAEINFTAVSYTFFDSKSNIDVQLPLAVKRYNALSKEQKAYFDTFAVVSFLSYSTTNVGNFITYAKDQSFDIDATSNNQAIALLEYMEYAEEQLEEHLILEAFDEFAEDSNLPEHSLTSSTFNVLNSNHTAAYKLVNEYFDSLDKDSQEIIENENSDWYKAYQYAESLIVAAEVDSAEQLIVGAYQAYLKAISNGAKIVYQDMETETISGYDELFVYYEYEEVVSSWAYIESEEVVSLTNQAKAAYDALSDDGKDLLESLGADDMIYENHYYNGTYVVTFAKDENGVGTNTVYNALEKLCDMNEIIETMIIISQYVNIDDYTSNSLAYERLTRLVYGMEGEDGVVGGMYFPTYSGKTGATDYRYAMKDIILSPERNYDAIIAEYKEWLLYVEAIEQYKTTAMYEFIFQIDSAVSALNKDDYETSVLSNASSSSAIYFLIIQAVMAEKVEIEYYVEEFDIYVSLDTVSGSFDLTNFYDQDILGGDSGVEIIPFIDDYGNFLEDKDNFAEIYEAYNEFLDVDDLLDSYIDAIREKD